MSNAINHLLPAAPPPAPSPPERGGLMGGALGSSTVDGAAIETHLVYIQNCAHHSRPLTSRFTQAVRWWRGSHLNRGFPQCVAYGLGGVE